MMGKKSGQKYDVALFSRDEEAYQKYLESIEDKFPKKLIKAYRSFKYTGVNHFHDFHISRISMTGKNGIVWPSKSALEIELIRPNDVIFRLHFSKIHQIYCNVLCGNWSEIWLDYVSDSWLGISEEGNYIFEMLFGWGDGRIRIDSEKLHMEEIRLIDYVTHWRKKAQKAQNKQNGK